MPRTTIHTGRHGEYHVCALLEAVGVEATRSDGDFDIIGLLPTGRLVKVEVKTAASSHRKGMFAFRMGKGDPDWIALYAIPTGRVLFIPVADIGERKYMRVHESEFTPDAQARSLAALLDFG